MKKTLILITTLLIILGCISSSFAQKTLAFPTAEGFGKYTIGGRGGRVFEVTNLNDSGEGSFREAVEFNGTRTVIFRVSGTITLNKPLIIKHPYITIAGQTAPGDGICIRKYPLEISTDQVIIRYLRVRLGDESGGDYDAVSSRFNKHLIIDHVSASWSIDETMSIYHNDSITVQWCIISESLYNSNHVKGHHGFGGIWGSNHGTYHHNLFAHHSSRNPRFASGSQNTDFRNNVVYNWGYQSTYGGENQQVGDARYSFSTINMVANYYKAGPATAQDKALNQIANPWSRNAEQDYGKWYIAENILHENPEISANNWNGGVQAQGGDAFLTSIKLSEPWPSMPIQQETAKQAFSSVLESAGAILPKRDAIDQRIVSETQNGTATFEGIAYKNQQKKLQTTSKTGIIDSQNEVGGWPILNSATAPVDTDHDGMPDSWELKNGLNPNDDNDRNKKDSAGYTMLENYLNSIKP